jgi:hypothetical protein
VCARVIRLLYGCKSPECALTTKTIFCALSSRRRTVMLSETHRAWRTWRGCCRDSCCCSVAGPTNARGEERDEATPPPPPTTRPRNATRTEARYDEDATRFISHNSRRKSARRKAFWLCQEDGTTNVQRCEGKQRRRNHSASKRVLKFQCMNSGKRTSFRRSRFSRFYL